MNKKLFISFLALPLMLAACGSGGGDDPSETSSTPSTSDQTTSAGDSSTSHDTPSHEEGEVTAYMNNLKATSRKDHFYLHYYRYAQTVADYNKWDVWSWAYSPKAGEGYRFDWVGRKSSADRMSATGDATIDSFGYVTCDIDLTATYDGGWNNTKKTMGGTPSNYYQADGKTLDEAIGVQIVESATRKSASSFWANDTGDVTLTLADFALENNDGTTSYHAFVSQDKVKDPTATPPTEQVDPFADDDGTNTTYGNKKYSDVNFKESIAKQKTSPLFLKGDSKVSYMKSGAGVGYQIMVSSFADSDGDGFGDILGITQKLDYLKDLGVNVLWLTPVQLSDSYHGYDIVDYTQVDPKYGSTASTHVTNGKVTAKSAMEDYKDLIKAAHAKGMGVVMDLVLNHTSPTNKWFIKSAQLDKDYRGYYQWGNHVTDKTGKIKEEKCWYPYGDHVYSYYAKFGSAMPELNYAYSSTRAAVVAVAKQWCETGVDGFRMDAVKHIFMSDEVAKDTGDTIVNDVTPKADYSSNLTKNLHFWKYLNREVKKDYPNCFFVGENFDGNADNVAPFYEGFDSCFDFLSYFNLTSIAAKASGNSAASAITGANASQAYGYLKTADGGEWSLSGKMAKYKSYRGDTPINGMFTSNHDIARTINRVAGETASASGIESQGTITASNYDKYNKFALLTQITQVLLPGCTWIYYGDELGMTGNFPAKDKDGNKFTSNSAYADLYYRQPMKWKHGGTVADGSLTTGYAVTGSGMTVAWDGINASTKVPDAAAQQKSATSHFSCLKKFVTLKASTPALIRGSLVPYEWNSNPYVFYFDRVLDGKTYKVFVNMSGTSQSVSSVTSGYTLDAAINGASLSSVPAGAAMVCHK